MQLSKLPEGNGHGGKTLSVGGTIRRRAPQPPRLWRARSRFPLACPCLLRFSRSVQRPREGLAAQVIVGVRLVVHEVRNGEGDLVVDLVVLRVDLRIDAD